MKEKEREIKEKVMKLNVKDMKEKVEYIVSIVNNCKGGSITSNSRH